MFLCFINLDRPYANITVIFYIKIWYFPLIRTQIYPTVDFLVVSITKSQKLSIADVQRKGILQNYEKRRHIFIDHEPQIPKLFDFSHVIALAFFNRLDGVRQVQMTYKRLNRVRLLSSFATLLLNKLFDLVYIHFSLSWGENKVQFVPFRLETIVVSGAKIFISSFTVT